MSHGTGSYYVVVSPEEQRRRAVAEHRRRCDSLASQLAGVLAECAALGLSLTAAPSTPAGDDLERLRTHESALASKLATARDHVTSIRRQVWATEMSRHLSTVAGGINLDIRPGQPRQTTKAPTAVDTELHDLRSSLEHALARSATIEDTTSRKRLSTIAEAALRALPDEVRVARGHLAILRTELHQVLNAQADLHRIRRQAEELSLTAAGLPHDGGETLRALIAEARTDADLALARKELAKAQAQAVAEADRRFVVEQAARALTRLGYDIGQEFVDVALAGRAVVEPPTLPGYGIELDFQEGRGRLLTETIAFTQDEGQDLTAQQAGCATVDDLGRELATSGVRLDRYHTASPGEMPMQRLTRETVQEQATGRRRRTTAPRERQA